MKKIAIIVNPNQNGLSPKEIKTIQTVISLEFPGYEIIVYANDNVPKNDENGFPDISEDFVIVYDTFDINYLVSAKMVEQCSSYPSEGRRWSENIFHIVLSRG